MSLTTFIIGRKFRAFHYSRSLCDEVREENEDENNFRLCFCIVVIIEMDFWVKFILRRKSINNSDPRKASAIETFNPQN